jgi:molybdopterin-guanine dinucleotide biosynthesis protein A
MVGAILAGGAGRRIGGAKASRELAGRPLVAYPVAALEPSCARLALVAKRGDELPELPGVELWNGEPPEPRHPATGIAYAIERAGERVMVCACDMPFLTDRECRELVKAALSAPRARAVVAVSDGTLQPVLGVYSPSARETLRQAAASGAPLVAAVEALAPALVDLPAQAVRSVDTREELAAAEREFRQLRSST